MKACPVKLGRDAKSYKPAQRFATVFCPRFARPDGKLKTAPGVIHYPR
jgi:hypothetical protein